MEYFKIGDKDYSAYVNELTVAHEANYNSQTNAAGNTVVDYINTKRIVTVGFIPLGSEKMKELLTAIRAFNLSITILNPDTAALETLNTIVPADEIQYYTIQVNKVLYNAMTVEFIEL